jgi:chaperone BCS1
MKTVFSAYGAIAAVILIVLGLVVYYAYGTFTNIGDVKARAAELYEWGNAQNQFATAGIGLWLLGVLTYLARDIPRKVWVFIVKQTTVTMTLNNCDMVFDNFLKWYHDTGRSKHSRTLVAQNNWDEKTDRYITQISSGYGMHFFFYNGKIFNFIRNEKDASQTKQTKESITLTTIGRSQIQFIELLDEITPEEERDDVTDIYKWNTSEQYWSRQGEQAARKFDSVILPKETKEEIVHHLDTFLKEREWYMNNGIPYRTGIILHGVPGTGKTSLVRGLCDYLNKPLYIINLNTLSDNQLEHAFSDLPRGSVCLMEDIDTYSVTNTREEDGDGAEKTGEAIAKAISGLTLAGLLNAIDGIIASDGRILIATTNHLEKLDPALVRKGRFNLTTEIGYLTEPCFREFFAKFYPNFPIPPNTKFVEDMVPATLQALIIDNRNEPAYVLEQCKDKSV